MLSSPTLLGEKTISVIQDHLKEEKKKNLKARGAMLCFMIVLFFYALYSTDGKMALINIIFIWAFFLLYTGYMIFEAYALGRFQLLISKDGLLLHKRNKEVRIARKEIILYSYKKQKNNNLVLFQIATFDGVYIFYTHYPYTIIEMITGKKPEEINALMRRIEMEQMNSQNTDNISKKEDEKRKKLFIASVSILFLYWIELAIYHHFSFFGNVGHLLYFWLSYIPFLLFVICLRFYVKNPCVKKGQKIIKKFIIFFMVISSIFAVGFTQLSFSISQDKTRIQTIEEKVHISLPHKVKIVTSTLGFNTKSYIQILNQEENLRLLDEVKNSGKWTNENSYSYSFILGLSEINMSQYQYFLFYNPVLNEYNNMSTYTLNSDCVLITYHSETRHMVIIEDMKCF